jgi:membrane associated rhomboid family serine protease
MNPESVFVRYGLVPSDLSFLNMFTGMFIHSDIVHLAANMLFLWLFGRAVEFAMGGIEYLMFYVGSGFFSAVVHVAIVAMFALKADVPVVGASGAIAGVLGVYAIRFHRAKFKIAGLQVPAILVLFVWLALQAVLGFVSLYVTTYHVRSVQISFQSVGYWSHIGGFVFGMVVAQITKMDVLGHKDYLMKRVKTCLEKGAIFDALRCSDELVRFDFTDPVSHAELARVWALLNDREQSIASYQKTIELFLRAGHGSDAMKYISDMKHFWPGAKLDPPTMFRMGCYLEETGRFSDASESFTKLADESPESVEAQMALLKAGQLQMMKLKDPQGSVETLQKLVDNYPHSDWKTYAQQLIDRAQLKMA